MYAGSGITLSKTHKIRCEAVDVSAVQRKIMWDRGGGVRGCRLGASVLNVSPGFGAKFRTESRKPTRPGKRMRIKVLRSLVRIVYTNESRLGQAGQGLSAFLAAQPTDLAGIVGRCGSRASVEPRIRFGRLCPRRSANRLSYTKVRIMFAKDQKNAANSGDEGVGKLRGLEWQEQSTWLRTRSGCRHC